MPEDDPRDVLRGIAYGSDPRISPGDRVRAIERLAELDRADRRIQAVERLSPEQVEEELALWGVEGAIRAHRGPEAVEPPEPDPREVLDLALEVNERLERRVAKLEAALQHEHRHRLLPPAPEPVA